jgi:hypothetical protein
MAIELFESLFDDERLVSLPEPRVAAAVADHLALREAYQSLLATLVVPDRQLAEVARHIPAAITVPVSILISGGAGGLIALARRDLRGVAVVSAEPALRDFDDLPGSAARIVSAASELESDNAVFVELPYAPGWLPAVELLESAGLYGKIAADLAEPQQTAEQLSILIEADLPFKITSRFSSGWLSVLTAVDALIDGASIDDAAEIMRSDDTGQIGADISGWDQATQSRVRHRVRRLGTDQVLEVIKDCAAVEQPEDS